MRATIGVIEFEVQDLSVPATAKEEGRAEEAEPILETHSDRWADRSVGACTEEEQDKAILIGAIAAGLVLAAVGATWYSRNSSGTASQTFVDDCGSGDLLLAVAPEAPAKNSTFERERFAACGTTGREDAESFEHQFGACAGASSASAAASAHAECAELGRLPRSPRSRVDKTVSAELSAYKKLAEPALLLRRNRASAKFTLRRRKRRERRVPSLAKRKRLR